MTPLPSPPTNYLYLVNKKNIFLRDFPPADVVMQDKCSVLVGGSSAGKEISLGSPYVCVALTTRGRARAAKKVKGQFGPELSSTLL